METKTRKNFVGLYVEHRRYEKIVARWQKENRNYEETKTDLHHKKRQRKYRGRAPRGDICYWQFRFRSPFYCFSSSFGWNSQGCRRLLQGQKQTQRGQPFYLINLSPFLGTAGIVLGRRKNKDGP